MTNFQVGDYVKFAGGRGEITKIEDRPNDGHLLHVYTSEVEGRRLCVRFAAVGGTNPAGEAAAVEPVWTVPLYVMSRTPNSRKPSCPEKRTRGDGDVAAAAAAADDPLPLQPFLPLLALPTVSAAAAPSVAPLDVAAVKVKTEPEEWLAFLR